MIESDSSPFSNYFQEDNLSYHEKIQRQSVKTVELVLGHNNSVLLTEFRKNKDHRAEQVLYYVYGYVDYYYHFHVLDFDLDVVVIDIPGLGYSRPYEV